MTGLVDFVKEYLPQSSLAAEDNRHLPEVLQQRLATAQATAEKNIARANEDIEPHAVGWKATFAKVQQGGMAKKTALRHLRRIAAEFSELTTPHAACRARCTHCCHIPVALCVAEADLIGEAIGRRPKTVPPGLTARQDYGYDNPCPFLTTAGCGIYEHRPLACRTHINLDEDELLCRLEKNFTVPLPLADVTSILLVYSLVAGGDSLADIRDFFPASKEPSL